jgi:hypothetical protein
MPLCSIITKRDFCTDDLRAGISSISLTTALRFRRFRASRISTIATTCEQASEQRRNIAGPLSMTGSARSGKRDRMPRAKPVIDITVATKLRAPSGRIFRIYSDGEMETLLSLGWRLVYADEEKLLPVSPGTKNPPNRNMP